MNLRSHPHRQAKTEGPFAAPSCLPRINLSPWPTSCTWPTSWRLPGVTCSTADCCAFAFLRWSLLFILVRMSQVDPPPDSLYSIPTHASEVQGINIWFQLTCWSGCSLLFMSLCPRMLEVCSVVKCFHNSNTLILLMGFVLLPTQPS